MAGCWKGLADASMPCGCRVVLEAHAKYCAGLKQIWDMYKDRFCHAAHRDNAHYMTRALRLAATEDSRAVRSADALEHTVLHHL